MKVRSQSFRALSQKSKCYTLASYSFLFICLLVRLLGIKIKMIPLWSCLAVTDSFSIAIVTERIAFMNRLRFLRLEFPVKQQTQGGANRGKSRQRERKQIEVVISQLSHLECAGKMLFSPSGVEMSPLSAE